MSCSLSAMTELNQRYLSEPEADVDTGRAALLLGVHPNTIRRWDKTGKLRSWRTPGGFRRFAMADLRALKAGAR